MVNQEKGRRRPVTQGLQGEQRPPLANTGDSCRQQKRGLAFGSGSGFHPFPDVSVTEGRDQVLKAKATMKMFKQSKSCSCACIQTFGFRVVILSFHGMESCCYRVFECDSLLSGLDGFNMMNEGSGNATATQVTLSQIGHLIGTAWCTDREKNTVTHKHKVLQ